MPIYSENQFIFQNSNGVSLYIKREDLLHPVVSGNKFRKLKYNILEAKSLDCTTIITFGGAYSNHIVAVAYAGKKAGLKTIGIIRGDEIEKDVELNPTLKNAKLFGMELVFVSRSHYKNKHESEYVDELKAKYGSFYLVPEGGTNHFGVKGCEEILEPTDTLFDYIACSVGTGGTISGLINSLKEHQKVLGFPALKGAFIKEDIRKFAKNNQWDLISDYHFGGYAKINSDLVRFINTFKSDFNIPLDPVYTGKMMYGLFDKIEKNHFPDGSKILAIHTGGLQGIEGMNLKLEKQKLPKLI
ncbi:1-aminocyclopropane-1-carboxylate deaminase/D-cysteine desulfhydrase [Flavobacterium sp.]|uniref:1-aminocyclopropane-1-carboxylate deaminase/D-cysteine desulfhydrase n=1 Tax=Flavobacterium sp. TaxID=239 RepID=UPI002FD9908C